MIGAGRNPVLFSLHDDLTTGTPLDAATDAILSTALASLPPPGIRVNHRVIAPGDEHALLPAEQIGFERSVVSVRRQSGAARIAARQLLCARGLGRLPLPRSRSGVALWPSSLIGSMAHDDDVAVAVIAELGQFSALGVDVEPSTPLPEGLARRVATSAERARYATAVIESRLLFVIKEAVYKAFHPLDGRFLDFHDIEVDLARNVATTRSGQRAEVRYLVHPRVVAVAFR